MKSANKNEQKEISRQCFKIFKEVKAGFWIKKESISLLGYFDCDISPECIELGTQLVKRDPKLLLSFHKEHYQKNSGGKRDLQKI